MSPEITALTTLVQRAHLLGTVGELLGWDEEKITLRFWIVAILAGLVGVTLFLASIDLLR